MKCATRTANGTHMDKMQLAVFTVNDCLYGLPLEVVGQVVLAALPTPLAGAPKGVVGMLDVRGRLLPVVDMRVRLGFPGRELRPEDHFVLADTGLREYVLWVDAALGVAEVAQTAPTPAEDVPTGLPALNGVVRLPEGMTYIYDLDACLSIAEEAQLARARRALAGGTDA